MPDFDSELGHSYLRGVRVCQGPRCPRICGEEDLFHAPTALAACCPRATRAGFYSRTGFCFSDCAEAYHVPVWVWGNLPFWDSEGACVAASFLLNKSPRSTGCGGLGRILRDRLKSMQPARSQQAAAGLSSGHGERREARSPKFIADLVSPYRALPLAAKMHCWAS